MLKSFKSEIISINEKEFILGALKEQQRIDGRKFYDLRKINIQFNPYKTGNVEVQLGTTRYLFKLFQNNYKFFFNIRVIAVVSCDIVPPYPDKPTEGFFIFNTEFSPMGK